MKYITKLKGSKETGKMFNKYKKLQPMAYMTNPLFSQDESSLLMRLRTRCVNGIRSDFGGMYTTKNCPMQTNCNSIDSLQHLLECQTIQEALHTNFVARHKVVFEDIFSEDIMRQKEATTLFQLLLETRERILSSPAADTGPLHCGDT